ncbi:MAG: hypothetical protein M3444_06665 [Acidobacteriota bacterium]|nr:hypothetical protein [Acidobacteriota bacterium]MDQ5837040.1 hypothetical protein [Acidobacteriota bacterium]
MRAAELPYDVRRQLLSQIREQVGQADYDRMVGTLGEDGLLDLAMEKAQGVARGQAGAQTKKPRSRLSTVVSVAVGVGLWAAFVYILLGFPQTFQDVLLALLILFLPGILSAVWALLRNLMRPF